MGLLKIFKNDKVEQLKAANEKLRMQVTDNNLLYRQLYNSLSGYFSLDKDQDLDYYIKNGFEKNASIYGTIMKLSLKAAGVPIKLVIKQTNGKEVEQEWSKYPELKRLIYKPNHYQNGKEHRTNAFMYKYVTGNTITYAPKYENGINKGKITRDGMLLMPVQDTEIYANGWRQMPSYYTVNFYQQESLRIAISDVWHERFPGLDMQNGAQFMGMSPLKAAANIIKSMNAGDKNLATLYGMGHAPGIVYKKISDSIDPGTPRDQQRQWKKNYTQSSAEQIPIFTYGDVGFAKVGTDDVASLRIIENSEHGSRVVSKIFGVDPSIFGDTGASTFNNMETAQKAMWEDRLIPDVDQYWEGFTEEIAYPYDSKLILKPDYDTIQALQPDKATKVVWVSKMFNDGVITGDEYLEKMGEEKTELPEMQIRFSSFNRVPLTDVINSSDEGATGNEEDNFFNENNIEEEM
jgi:HK97 family phage portal protein